MVILEKTIFNTNIQDIIETLKYDLKTKGIELFSSIKLGQDNIQVSCPYHKEGKEKKPSCGISLYPKKGFEAGAVHCFTCGTTKKLTEMISDCFGHYNDNGKYGLQWLKDKFDGNTEESRKVDIFINKNTKKAIEYIEDDELKNYRYYHPYMFDRKLTKEVIEQFDIGFDDQTNSITFPVRDKNGNCLFVARRRVDCKIFNYPSGATKPIYGIYELPKGCKEVIVCESFFNALTCYVYGKPAIALMGLGSKQQIEELKKLPVRTLILGLDGDDAGNRASVKIRQALKDHFIIKRMILPKDKDINDLTEEEFKNIEIML